MQDNLRLMIFSIIGVVVAWFIIMTIDVNMFLHTNINESVSGSVPINRTDVGDRCGSDYVNTDTLIDFKLNNSGQIVYLCPLNMSPLRKTVIANSLPAAFRASLTPLQRSKVKVTYPDLTPQLIPAAEPMNAGVPQQSQLQQQAPAAVSSVEPSAPPQTIEPTTQVAPAPAAPQPTPTQMEAPQPSMGNTPPPIQPTSVPVPTTQQPAS